jgi:DNA gyrase inhibitor GyrI
MNERATTTQDYAVRLARVVTWLADHLGTWLAQSGEEPADAPCVEEYCSAA